MGAGTTNLFFCKAEVLHKLRMELEYKEGVKIYNRYLMKVNSICNRHKTTCH